MPVRPPDPDLEASTDRWMSAGVILTVLMFLAFPVYRLYEPSSRAEARETQTASLVVQGQVLYQASCASCHGVEGEGIDAPALNSQQFLLNATDGQIFGLIAHGVPGSGMAAYSLDFGGFLTSEQIDSVVTYLRSLEEDAPDRPDWRSPGSAGAGGHDDEEPADAHDDEEPADAHDDEEPADAHDDEEPAGAHDEEEAEGGEESGEEVFDAAATFNATCARCHGADLSGDTAPALNATSHSLGEPDAHLIEAIMFGRDEMPAFADQLSEDEIAAIVDYIREVQASG